MVKPKFHTRKLSEFRAMDDKKKRESLFKMLASVVLSSAVIVWGYWFFVASNYVDTDNAYVGAEIAQVTPSVGGTVKEVLVVDTQKVKAGDVLVQIDDIDAKLSYDRATANFSRAEIEVKRTKLDYSRRKALAASGSVSGEELSNAENAYHAAQAAFDAAKSAEEQAEVDLKRTIVTAPVDGVVAKRDVQVGQRVAAGMHLMSVVPLDSVHVNANFKEVQLRKVKVGQEVELWSDLYGKGVVYHGVVEGMAGGTGSVFSLIPAQNATGNWIKVVQRLPVRISLDSKELAAHPLQVGLSMNVAIDISKDE